MVVTHSKKILLNTTSLVEKQMRHDIHLRFQFASNYPQNNKS